MLLGSIISLYFNFSEHTLLESSYFELDALAQYFVTVVMGVGVFIAAYAFFYMKGNHSFVKFFIALGFFQLGMLGLALSQHWLLFIISWELTSVASFFLISHEVKNITSQKGAMRTFIVTVLGGLSLLFLAFWSYGQTGSWYFNDSYVWMKGLSGVSSVLVVALVFMAVATKSAQWPFQFWLPGAMAAPTPVSAYLHSATLVKAGIFLLLRLSPALKEHSSWSVFFVVGAMSYLLGGFWAITKKDLKSILAYSTIAQLGLMVMFLGLGTDWAIFAVLVHLLSHAFFKASLFMSVGIIDHSFHTRNISVIHSLFKYLPMIVVSMVVASLAMAGFPGLNGFVSKELLLKAGVYQSEYPITLVVGIVILGAVFTCAYLYKMLLQLLKPDLSKKLSFHHPGLAIGLFPLALVVACVVVGLFPYLFKDLYFNVLEMLSSGSKQDYLMTYLKPWFGFDWLLALGLSSLVLGFFYYQIYLKQQKIFSKLASLRGAYIFDQVLEAIMNLGSKVSYFINDSRSVSFWLLLPGVFSFLVLGNLFWDINIFDTIFSRFDFSLKWSTTFVVFCLLSILMMFSAFMMLFNRSKQKWVDVVCLGLNGTLLIIFFYFLGAPDLVLTQASVEVASLSLFALCILLTGKKIKLKNDDKKSAFTAGLRIVSCSLMAIGGFLLALMTLNPHTNSAAMMNYLQNAYTLAGGKNLVNIILVDFRGFDTLGEILVLGATAVGVYAFLRRRRVFKKLPQLGLYKKTDSSWSRNWFSILICFIFVVGLFFHFRGHYYPGGGFIAGLVIGLSLVGQKFFWPESYKRLIFFSQPFYLLFVGFALALVSVLAPVIVGHNVFRSYQWGFFVSSTFFDTGLLLLVIATVVILIGSPKEELPEEDVSAI